MRGKQAAKARNRLANLDNEILQEVVADRDSLREELDAERLKVKDVERDLNGKAMRLAGEMSRADVERLTGELNAERMGRANDKEHLAFGLFRLFAGDDYELTSRDKFHAIAELLGVGDKIGELLTMGATGFNRKVRRGSVGSSRRIDSALDEIESRGIDRKGVMPR